MPSKIRKQNTTVVIQDYEVEYVVHKNGVDLSQSQFVDRTPFVTPARDQRIIRFE